MSLLRSSNTFKDHKEKFYSILTLKLKGGAILLVVAISLLITLLVVSLVLFSYYKRLETNSSLLTIRLVDNANSGIQLMLSDEMIVPPGDSMAIDLYGEQSDSVWLSRYYYGLFEILQAKAIHRHLNYSKCAMSGGSISGTSKSALYLKDNNKPLSVCGITMLNGDCYLPEVGIKRAYIEGQSFVGSNMVNGNVLKSNKSLPPINQVMVNHLFEYLNNVNQPVTNESSVDGPDVTTDSLFNSFNQMPVIVYGNSLLTISEQKLAGNIILIAKDSIVIRNTAMLVNVMLFAPQIRFEENCKGSFQAFAKDTVIVSAKCHFTYPSVIGILNNDPNKKGLIRIDSSVLIEGLVFTSQVTSNQINNNSIIVEAEAVVYGQVYTTGTLDLKGSIYGNVMCDHFILKTPSSFYENHLLNATIDAKKISSAFAFPLLLMEFTPNRIVQWLN